MRKPKTIARAERLMDLQGQMRRAAEWDLAETRRRIAALEAGQAELLAALSDQAGGLFLEAAARRLRGLAGEAADLGRTAERQAEAVREQALAQKRSERRLARLGAEHRREEERRDLLARLDALAAGGDASLP
ncbi:hypothetical protein [Methylobacterium oryzisoli]|uniref:hypothetical protein n=1 Tax=Methylobacterium oryzisoli TaxID=3385502 RepID=UPI003891D0B7